MSDPVYWPGNLLPTRVLFKLNVPSTSGGLSTTNDEQLVFGWPRWRARLTFNIRRMIGTNPRQRILAARAMEFIMKGRVRTILIGPFDQANSPAGLAGGGGGMITGIPLSDGALFDDGSGFSQPATMAFAAAPAEEGTNTLTVTMESGREPQAGQFFGLKGNELYGIEGVEVSGSAFILTFVPPLINAVETGDFCDIEDPKCEMRGAADSTGELDFGPGHAAVQTLELVEARGA